MHESGVAATTAFLELCLGRCYMQSHSLRLDGTLTPLLFFFTLLKTTPIRMHSLQPIRWAVLSMLLIFTLLLPAQAAITLHYFAHTACNANTAISDYTYASPAGSDSACVAAPQNAVALYVDGIDDGCTSMSQQCKNGGS